MLIITNCKFTPQSTIDLARWQVWWTLNPVLSIRTLSNVPNSEIIRSEVKPSRWIIHKASDTHTQCQCHLVIVILIEFDCTGWINKTKNTHFCSKQQLCPWKQLSVPNLCCVTELTAVQCTTRSHSGSYKSTPRTSSIEVRTGSHITPYWRDRYVLWCTDSWLACRRLIDAKQ